MSKTNCVNCGAAKDIEEIKCPFCGTIYLDLTAIDFSSDDPIICDFIMPHTKDILQMVAKPRLEKAIIKDELSEFIGFATEERIPFTYNRCAEFDVSFIPIPRNGVLFTVRSNKA